ncbi:MAG: DinB family protein [Bacteroidota bacterium]
MTSPELLSEIVSRAIHHLEWNYERVERCLLVFEEDHIWMRENENTLSIGNQLLHLSGNLRQWVLHSLGGQVDDRNRAEEFATINGKSQKALMAELKSVVEACVSVAEAIDETELMRVRAVQAYTLTGLAALIHAVEHFSYHTGQIIQLTKMRYNISLDFYGGQALDTTN